MSAPAPFNVEWSGSVTKNGSQHVYIVDANRRKIAAIWGPSAEKEGTAALFMAAPEMLAALKQYIAEYKNLEDQAPQYPECGQCNLGTGPHNQTCALHLALPAIRDAEGGL